MGFLQFYALPHCFSKYLTNPRYMISNWPISLKQTLPIPNNFLLYRQQAKYSKTLIHHIPHLAPMEECKQKFPIMCYFNALPLSTNGHPRYTTTNQGEQVVALFCTILFKWWHKFELWFDGLKINHLKTQTMHVCNIKIKQKCHQFVLIFLLQYTTFIAVILTYFYHIISIPQF
jgi:hypothetical protein